MLHRKLTSQVVPPTAKVSRQDADGYSTATINGRTVYCKRLADGSYRQVSNKWSWRQRIDGKIVDRPTGLESKGAAMSLVAQWDRQTELVKAGLVTAEEVKQSQKPVKLLKDAIEEYLRHQAGTVSEKHLYNQRLRLGRLVAETDAKNISTFADALPKWASKFSGELSPRNLNIHLASGIAFVRWAYSLGYASRAAMDSLSRIRKQRDGSQANPRRSLTADELERLMSVATPERRLIYAILAGTGFRRNEAASLRVEDFDLKNKTLTLPAQFAKNGIRAVQPISGQRADAIADHIGRRTTGLIVTIPGSFINRFNRDLKAAGIAKTDHEGRHVDVHSLRRTYVSKLLSSGASVKVTQTLARHSDPALTLNVYAELAKGDLEAAVFMAFKDTKKDTLLDLQRVRLTTNGQLRFTYTNVPESLKQAVWMKHGKVNEVSRPAWEAGILPLNYACVFLIMPHTTCTVKTKLAKELTTPILDSVKNMTIIKFMSDEKVEILRRHRIQITAQRLAVLRAVSKWPHCTADVVAEKVRSEIGTISRQAVYDVLGVLVDKGIIRRIEPAGSPALYEDRVGDNHHHLICRKCGKTVDVNCSSGKTPCLTPDEKMGYEVDEAELIFWGTCPECLPANQSRANK